MSQGKKPVLPQLLLLMAVIRSDWATHLDIKVAGAIIDNYWHDYGNSRAAVSFLQLATGEVTPRRIRESLRRLIDHGVFSILRKGQGTRPTEYLLNFDWAQTVPKPKKLEGVKITPSEGIKITPSTDARGGKNYPPNLLTLPAYCRERESMESPCARLTPRKEEGKDIVVMAWQDKFEEFWRVYDRQPWHDDPEPVRQAFMAKCQAGTNPDDVLAGTRAYVAVRTEPKFRDKPGEFIERELYRKEHKAPSKKSNPKSNNRNHGSDMADLSRYLDEQGL